MAQNHCHRRPSAAPAAIPIGPSPKMVWLRTGLFLYPLWNGWNRGNTGWLWAAKETRDTTSLNGPCPLCFVFPENLRKIPWHKRQGPADLAVWFSGFGNTQKGNPTERPVSGWLSARGPLLPGLQLLPAICNHGSRGPWDQVTRGGGIASECPGLKSWLQLSDVGNFLLLSEPDYKMKITILPFRVAETSKCDLPP